MILLKKNNEIDMFEDDFSKAIQSLNKGSIIVYPTDTLYALGADIFNEKAVNQIFRIKKRPSSIPLPVAVSDFDSMQKLAHVNDKVKSLVDFFLPGPLTLILNKRECVSDLITSGNNKVAVRIPDNDIALKLLSDFGPLTVTSANIHGEKTLGIINDIKMQLNQQNISVYLDYGILQGKPSTIVDITSENIKIIREGTITSDEILDVI